MGKILLITVIVLVFVKALARPSLGVSAYYFLAILGPQYIWWWAFDGLRVSLYVALATLCGVLLKVFSQGVNYFYLKTALNLWVLILLIFLNISYFFGPYVPLFNYPTLSPEKIYSITNTIFIFYFIAVAIANEIYSLKMLSFVIIIITLYMTYWANNQYFSHNWSQFTFGRLHGPSDVNGNSMYADENVLALLYLMGIPYIFYISRLINNKIYKYLMMSSIPLAIHAVFLTGSRGALLSLAIVIFIISIKSKNLIFASVVPVAFILFFNMQGGDVMKNRSQSIVSYEDDGSATGRINAWKGGWNMVKAHPITGVGLGSFVVALPDFYPTNPRVAHNTLVQYSGESGVFAGLAYVIIIGLFYYNAININSYCKNFSTSKNINFIVQLNNANTVSFSGLTICSCFLSLTLYEIFFVLLVINNSLAVKCKIEEIELANISL